MNYFKKKVFGCLVFDEYDTRQPSQLMLATGPNGAPTGVYLVLLFTVWQTAITEHFLAYLLIPFF